MIKEISSDVFKEFLASNKATHKQVSINTKGVHYGYFVDELVGVISINDTTKTRRVKGFLVSEAHQKQGIGRMLLNHVLVNKKMTAFATVKSIGLFLSVGFKVKNKLSNNIKFLVR